MGNKPGSGPGGYCVCPKCGYKKAIVSYKSVLTNSKSSISVRIVECPKCGYKSKPFL